MAACSSSGSKSSGGSGSSGGKVGVSLILKTLTNPYFVSMEKDAKTEAAKDNVSLTVAAGKSDGDTQSQISAIDNAISRGDKGILITINGDAVNTELKKAKSAGLFVIALDTAPTPVSTVDITYATDNEQAGKLIGQYAAAKLAGGKAVIAMLDLFNNQVVSVDTSRDHGFLEGMGIDPGSKTQNGQEAKSGKYTGGKGGDYVVACHQPTQGAIPGGKTAMENCLSSNGDINVVYTINEPAADGAYQALQAAGKKNVLILTIDGSCKYVNGLLKNGTIAADSAQYPGKMASVGVSTIASLAKGGAKPTLPAGADFINTGTALVTANPLSGVESQTPDKAAQACWGS
jgi:fructose transport system substrate-binding protein